MALRCQTARSVQAESVSSQLRGNLLEAATLGQLGLRLLGRLERRGGAALADQRRGDLVAHFFERTHGRGTMLLHLEDGDAVF